MRCMMRASWARGGCVARKCGPEVEFRSSEVETGSRDWQFKPEVEFGFGD